MSGPEPVDDRQISQAEAAYDADAPLKLLYGGSIVVQLGSQLYPSVTAAVAELISNAWDADAGTAWVTVPLGDRWTKDATIEVLDDGRGMSRRETQFKYLVVGRERRREDQTDETPTGRKLHGRKGIGKLAAFGTGRRLEVVTQQEGEPAVGFRLDYDLLRGLEPAESAEVEEFDPGLLLDRFGSPLKSGTRVRLTDVQAKRRPSVDRFMLSMRRRFGLDESVMRVEINGEPLRRFDMDFAYRFPGDATPPQAIGQRDGFVIESVDDGTGTERELRWWIGFTDRPVKDELLQGITILVRGKQAQRPFKFERTGGAAGQLGYEYLVGEVHADWIDDGFDDDQDLIASNRDTLQLEDPRLQPLIQWGRHRLQWALAERDRLRQGARLRKWGEDLPSMRPLLGQVSTREQQALGRVAERLARIDGLGDQQIAEVMQQVVNAREQSTVANVAQEIAALGDATTARTWRMAADVAAIERRGAVSTVTARLALIEQLRELLFDGSAPPDLGAAMRDFPWLVDLAYDRSPTTLLDASRELQRATVLIGAAAWAPDAASTVLAAAWVDDGDLADWASNARATAEAHDGQLVLVTPAPLPARDWSSVAWDEALSLSRRQHQAWRDLAKAPES